MILRDPLVSAEWLKDNIDAPDLRVVDATWLPQFQFPDTSGRERYDEGHIPGAVFFDIDLIADRKSPLPHMLPESVHFSSAVRKLGIGDGNRLVIYDSNRYFAAARVWWMMRVMGAEEVSVLDGGWEAWKAAGGEIEDMPPVLVERHFTPRVRAELVKSADQVAGHDPDAVLDARPAERFEGVSPEPREDIPSGHIPGSRNLPWTLFVDEEGLFANPDKIRKMVPDMRKPIICTCGSGVSAALIALAYARIGVDNVSIYDGSWTDWASSGRPIETAA